MPVVPEDRQPALLWEMLDYPESQEVREAFLHAVLALPRLDGVSIAPQTHGVMFPLGVCRGDDWCFSLKPARSWLKLWVRRPELSGYHVTEAVMRQAFAGVETTGSNELTLRIFTLQDMQRFVRLVRTSRR